MHPTSPLCSPYPDVPAGAVIGYEDHITLQTLPNEGGQVDYVYIYIGSIIAINIGHACKHT